MWTIAGGNNPDPYQGGIMEFHRFARALSICASLAILLLSTIAPAKDGRDFMAYYHIHELSQVGETVQVNIQVRLFNYSEGDIKQGTVAVYDSQPTRIALGSFKPIKLIRTRREVNLIQPFTVSKSEYERWQHGASPLLFFVFKDASGHSSQRPIELILRPLPPVEPGQ
jgi:hypothetical protein